VGSRWRHDARCTSCLNISPTYKDTNNVPKTQAVKGCALLDLHLVICAEDCGVNFEDNVDFRHGSIRENISFHTEMQ
jgi:hypothetical protein